MTDATGAWAFDRLWAEVQERTPDMVSLAQHFHYAHLPEPLARLSQTFCLTALTLVREIEKDDPQLTIALQRLLESKDAAVRAMRVARGGDPS